MKGTLKGIKQPELFFNMIAMSMVLRGEKIYKYIKNSDPYEQKYDKKHHFILVPNKNYSPLAGQKKAFLKSSLKEQIKELDSDFREAVFDQIAEIELEAKEAVIKSNTVDCPDGDTMYACEILNSLRADVEKEIRANQKDDGGATM